LSLVWPKDYSENVRISGEINDILTKFCRLKFAILEQGRNFSKGVPHRAASAATRFNEELGRTPQEYAQKK
jgi:hypothetical protein